MLLADTPPRGTALVSDLKGFVDEDIKVLVSFPGIKGAGVFEGFATGFCAACCCYSKRDKKN